MTNPTTPPTVEHTLILRSVPSSVPEAIRLRRLLKAALRQYGFRLADYSAVDVPRGRRDESISTATNEET